MSDLPITGEVSNSKLAAVFDTELAARAAASALTHDTSLQRAQVKVITPSEPHPGIKLEPEGQGIWRTIVVAHVWFGIAGMVAGALAFAVAMGMGVPAVALSPWPAGVAMTAFGGLGGLFVGGLVALRPDHDAYILATRDAMSEQRFTVLVHALSAEQRDRAAALLSARGAHVTSTF